MPKGDRPSWRVKYRNFAEMVQGVLLVDAELELTDRLFLNALAAHSVTEDPHPGNARLMRACQVMSRQGLNGISDRVCNQHRLAVMVKKGGGKGNANVYRICVEDPRFPPPKKPATDALRDNDEETCNSGVAGKPPAEPATGNAETRNDESGNPQRQPAIPATETIQTRNARVAPEFNSECNSRIHTEAEAERGDRKRAATAAVCFPAKTEKQKQLEVDRQFAKSRELSIAAAFKLLEYHRRPFGSFAFQRVFVDQLDESGRVRGDSDVWEFSRRMEEERKVCQDTREFLLAESQFYRALIETMEATIIACQQADIPVPKPFFDEKRVAESKVPESVAAAVYRPKPPWARTIEDNRRHAQEVDEFFDNLEKKRRTSQPAPQPPIVYNRSEYGPIRERTPEEQAAIDRVFAEYKAKNPPVPTKREESKREVPAFIKPYEEIVNAQFEAEKQRIGAQNQKELTPEDKAEIAVWKRKMRIEIGRASEEDFKAEREEQERNAKADKSVA